MDMVALLRGRLTESSSRTLVPPTAENSKFLVKEEIYCTTSNLYVQLVQHRNGSKYVVTSNYRQYTIALSTRC
jgi:hypothetical protein